MINTSQITQLSDYKDSKIPPMTITFETKVWENDWEIMLKTDRIKQMIEQCQHTFEEKILYINNVSDLEAVKLAADRLVAEKIIPKFVVVSEHAEAALKFFSLSKDKLDKGYYYSIAELVSIYLTNTKYLLHFASDAIVAPRTRKDWLRQHNYLRATYKRGNYLHQKFTNTPWKKKVSILLNCPTLFKK